MGVQVIANPRFIYLAVDNAIELDTGKLYLVAAGGNPQELLLMSTASRPAGYYHIPFGYLILYGEADVGASGAKSRCVLFNPLTPIYLSDEARVMEDVVGGEQFIYNPHVSLRKNTIEPLAH